MTCHFDRTCIDSSFHCEWENDQLDHSDFRLQGQEPRPFSCCCCLCRSLLGWGRGEGPKKAPEGNGDPEMASGEGRAGRWAKVRHLPRSLPKVRRAQVGGMGGAVEEMRHRVVGGATLGAKRGGESSNSEKVIAQGRGETRPERRQGGSEGAG